MKPRIARVQRKTRETDIQVALNLDGRGQGSIRSGMPFLDHMLELLARHGMFDLEVKARGDLAVDYHHTVEDIGICLGQALDQALGNKRGIGRYGEATLPMDEARATVCLDISGRPFLAYRVGIRKAKIGEFSLGLVKSFLKAFADHARLTLHVNLLCAEDPHHAIEAVFKACGRALRSAVELDPRAKGIPSTKGTI